MRRFFACAALVAAAAGPALAAGPKKGRSPMAIQLKSSAFSEGQPIPAKYSCSGEDLSPPLEWSGLPKGTTSLALIMDDPDAPPGTWVHWVAFDLPASSKGLPEAASKSMPDGAVQGRSWGVDDFEKNAYGGPCPPPGKPHRYFFKLYALDKKLGLGPDADKNDVIKAMKGHVLAEGRLMGTFKR